jgi:hypothetical protein
LVALVVLGLYGMFQHGSLRTMPKMPDLSSLPDMTSFTSRDRPSLQPPRLTPATRPASLPPKKESKGTAPPTDESSDVDHYFNGKIEYPRLSGSLDKLGRAPFGKASGRVLYAASSLKSAANLMPLACEMGRVNKSEVHMAFFGRNALPLLEILSVNGHTQQDCNVMFHDGRADFAEYSTERRAELSILGAIKQINEFVNPQAIVVDGGKHEDTFFTTAIHQRAEDYAKTLITIPGKKYEDFSWITHLDADSAESWAKPTIDILVQAPRHGSGSLIRLLKSLKAGDYSGLKTPRLVVELPPVVEPFAMQWLNDLVWPPTESGLLPSQSNLLSLHHRIPSQQMTSDQSALRFVESFYPSDPQFHHVLVLSPQAELSPLFFHNLHFSILHYRHSKKWWEAADIMGVSLDRPSVLIDGVTPFVAPGVRGLPKLATVDADARNPANLPFLYQSSGLGATLVFGDKWATFHDFLLRRLEATRKGLAKPQKKLVSTGEPAWSEYLLELMRARGWSVMHPAYDFVELHDELAEVPEEFLQPPADAAKSSSSKKAPPKTGKDKQALNPTPFDPSTISKDKESPESNPSSGPKTMPLHKYLPFNGFLPELAVMPYITHKGGSELRVAVKKLTEEYLAFFRREIGGCDSAAAEAKKQETAAVGLTGTTSDLFCLPDGFGTAQYKESSEGSDVLGQQQALAPAGGSSNSNSTSKDDADSMAQQNAVLPGLEKQTFAMLDHPDVEIGMAVPPQRPEGGYGPKRPLLRGLEVLPPKGEE